MNRPRHPGRNCREAAAGTAAVASVRSPPETTRGAQCALYHRWKCPWCAAARQAIENVSAPVELVEVPYEREERDEVDGVSGQRRVPVLVNGDTVVVASRQIVRHLYATYGGAGSPLDRRAR